MTTNPYESPSERDDAAIQRLRTSLRWAVVPAAVLVELAGHYYFGRSFIGKGVFVGFVSAVLLASHRSAWLLILASGCGAAIGFTLDLLLSHAYPMPPGTRRKWGDGPEAMAFVSTLAAVGGFVYGLLLGSGAAIVRAIWRALKVRW